MGIEIHQGRFVDTVSESVFGPECKSDQEAEILAYEVERTTGANVRAHEPERLVELLADLREGNLLTRETHSSKACYCGSGKRWVSKLQQIGKLAATRCADCSGTEDKSATLVAKPEVPSAKVIDLFEALKNSLKKGSAS